MKPSLSLTGLTPAQIQQLQTLAEHFRTANDRHKAKTAKPDSDLSFLFFSSEILQPFDRSVLYGNRA